MSIPIEELRRIEGLGLSAHEQIVDAYIALGYDLDRIAIVKGYYQPDSAAVLKAYGFQLGREWGDEDDDRKRYAHLPQSLVNEYVSTYFPGLDSANPKGRDITLKQYLDVYHRDWRNEREESPGILGRKLSREEQKIMNGENPYESQETFRKGNAQWKK